MVLRRQVTASVVESRFVGLAGEDMARRAVCRCYYGVGVIMEHNVSNIGIICSDGCVSQSAAGGYGLTTLGQVCVQQ